MLEKFVREKHCSEKKKWIQPGLRARERSRGSLPSVVPQMCFSSSTWYFGKPIQCLVLNTNFRSYFIWNFYGHIHDIGCEANKEQLNGCQDKYSITELNALQNIQLNFNQFVSLAIHHVTINRIFRAVKGTVSCSFIGQ